jgi:3-isopropylmalate dehydrogenase
MSTEATFSIAVFAGDGIGPEVTDAALDVLRRVEEAVGGYRLDCTRVEAGAAHYRD